MTVVCRAGGLSIGSVGKACSVVQHGGLLSAGKTLITGHLGTAASAALGGRSVLGTATGVLGGAGSALGSATGALGGAGSALGSAATAIGLAALLTWVLGGAKYALGITAHVLGETTTPQLQTTWFSSTYWRVAAIAAVLTLPFLFAAAIQALLQSDLALLMRALGYLPLAMLAVGIAAPLTTLLLAASDQLSAIVSSAAGNASGHFLQASAQSIGGIGLISASPFIVFFAGLLTVAGAFVLWLELLLREAAVYVIVLLMPLAFAALVWPARRIWAIRAVELLVALILSKFAIVAVLSLGGAALGQSGLHSVSGLLAGFVLIVMGAFAPWALLRLLPLTELASGAAVSLRADGSALRRWAEHADAGSRMAHEFASRIPSQREPRARPSDGTEGALAATDGLASVGRRSVSGEDEATAPSNPTEAPSHTGAASSPPGEAMGAATDQQLGPDWFHSDDLDQANELDLESQPPGNREPPPPPRPQDAER